ncbi:hypothetical protein KW795_01015 [Candidatus Microgenomates bacterium]|nr:hypothetical protein [Candidatus Microgenomates bacterium]
MTLDRLTEVQIRSTELGIFGVRSDSVISEYDRLSILDYLADVVGNPNDLFFSLPVNPSLIKKIMRRW